MVALSMQTGVIISASRHHQFAVNASLSPFTTATRQLSSRNADALLRWEDEGMGEAAAAERRRKMEWRLIGNSGVQCVMDLLRRWFEVQRTWEMAQADLAVRPLGVDEDVWLPVQVKTSKEKITRFWFFGRVHHYADMPVICVALSDLRIWCYSGSVLQQRLTYGKLSVYENGRWNHESFRCSRALEGPASLSHKLLVAYQDPSFTKDSLANIMLQRSETQQKGQESVAAWADLLSAADVEVRQQLIYEMTPVDAVWWWNKKRFPIQHKQAFLHHCNNGSYHVVL
ncbi:unnamed protein product [Vitrella brassicaformis CCMP3155]|uniref:Uncharacterized protein n=1 Tax=Vitrella brassicaformis (strain CCMP3155) TaxID=1169540 RepID=A0A0G4F8H9_VITBC|nr:unnamed protein product [Vitrella brassicaformis CCMP3155]|eukprot:CEM09040.1 unnamed protein product [Vitrella brassicaformis CCMP3155]